MNFYVKSFGCRTNQAEIQDIIIKLEASGYKYTNDIVKSSFCILNTCSVTENAERKTIKFIDRAYKSYDKTWLIIGCTVTKEKSELELKYKKYIFIDNKNKNRLPDIVKSKFPVHENIIYHSTYRSRIFLKIQDGCNFRCSFCIVPSLRGKAKSTPAAQILEKAKFYSALGYKEIILTGINLSSFGYDLFPRENLLNLVKGLDKIKDLGLIRLSTLDPRFIRYDFIKELSKISKLAESFHFSFQSGSNSVLRRMSRGSKILEYHKILHDFFSFFPLANYGSDIMVGFPGESEKEFLETLDFVKTSPLNYIHIFPYSPREGTKAFFKDPVPANIVNKRLKELKDVDKTLRINFRESQREKILQGIIVEENDTCSYVTTKNYFRVKVKPTRGLKKRLVEVRIDRVIDENECEGYLV